MTLKAQNHPILVFDGNYSLSQPSRYIINDKQGVEILDELYHIKYTCKYDNNHIIVKNDNEGKIVMNINYNEMIRPIEKFTFYLGQDETTEIATMKLKRSLLSKKYTVEFMNKTNKNREELHFKCDLSFSSCEVYSGSKKFGAPLICKIKQKPVKDIIGTTFIVDIAPDVDRLFMLAIGVVFERLNLINTQITS